MTAADRVEHQYPVAELNPAAESQEAGSTIKAFDGLREQYPAFRSDFGPGFWVLTRFDEILEAYRDFELFSSRAITVLDPEPAYQWIPEMLDPPEHTVWRRLLRPLFTPVTADAMRKRISEHCTSLIDRVIEAGSCDFVRDFAGAYPTMIFLELIGLPTSELETFMRWEYEILHLPASDRRTEIRRHALAQVAARFTDLIAERRRHPADDLVTAALSFEIDGRPIPGEQLLGLFVVLFLAGLDTVTAQLSYSFWHLATHEADRVRVATDPDIIPDAVEELLRVYGIVLPGRKLTSDVVIHGCPMSAGDMVLLPINAANRDPRSFPRPDVVDFDRPRKNHIAFGAGPHRCIGAHLARQELQIALAEWHARIPDYRVPEGSHVAEHGGQVLGLDTLPLTWH